MAVEVGWLAVEGAAAWEHRWPSMTESSTSSESRGGGITMASLMEPG